ncbi:MAG: lytic murein transglycosylase [Aliishimia sp.]
MPVTRRAFGAGLSALLLGGCSATAQSGGTTRVANAWPTQPNPAFNTWLRGFRPRAASAGISESTLARTFGSIGFIPKVIERDRNQTEFKRSLQDYLAIAASDERIAAGQQKLREVGATLSAIETRYGVPANVVCAIWGLESRFGARRGDVPVLSALATLSFDGRRGVFFEKQLIAALKIIQTGDTTQSKLVGSWAGAMGHTQFIPTSYQAFAVDFTGDGRRDIWSDDPSDALASAAAYLSKNGWQRGRLWGLEVRLPSGFNGPFGRGTRQSVASWNAAGVRTMQGGQIPDNGAGSVIIPAGRTGPAFLVFRNFRTILTYNNAESYAIGIGHLSDRIVGGAPIQGRFPPDEFGLSIQDRKDLQLGLTRAGFDTGTPDGVLGSKTETAIKGYQQANGLAVTGQPSQDLLKRLR